MVALLAEGVDRNYRENDTLDGCPESPSSRRAWIEIILSMLQPAALTVALLAEGVDRNTSTASTVPSA